MKLPHSIIHSKTFTDLGDLAATQLPEGHTRQERIAELDKINELHGDKPGMGLYLAMKFQQLNGFTDEFYQQWVKATVSIEAMSSTTGLKLVNFQVLAKDNESVYGSVATHLSESTAKQIVPAKEIIEKDFAAELFMEYEKDEEICCIDIISYDIESLLSWVKENDPEAYKLIPVFNVAKFNFLANAAAAGTYLEYRAVEPDFDPESELSFELTTDDFVPERGTVEESINEIKARGFVAELQYYPNTPVGSCIFYGTDPQALLDHVVTD